MWTNPDRSARVERTAPQQGDSLQGNSHRFFQSCRRKTWAAVAPVIAAVSILTGCTVGPDFEPLPAPILDGWQKSNELRIDASTGLTSRSEPEIFWWKVFDDPVLDKLVRMAYRQNLTLRSAGIRIYEARAQLGIIIGDAFPQSQQVGAGFKQERVSDNVGVLRDISRFIDIDPSFRRWDVGFDAGWEIDIWGKFRRGIEAADANLIAKIATYDDVLVTLTGDVAKAYVAIRELQEELAITRENISLQTQSLGITKLRLKDGVTTELDVQEATILLNNTKSLLPKLESDLAQAKNALSLLLGLPPIDIDPLLRPSRGVPRPPLDVAVGIPAQLLTRRPDIRAAELRAQSRAAQIGVAKADLYPAFTVSGAIGLKSSDLVDLFQRRSITGVINPAVSWDILNYGRIRNNVRVQDAKYQEAITDFEQKVLSAYKEVEDALVGFAKAKEQALYLRRSVAASRRAVKIATAQYRDGTADYTRVLNSQQALLQSQAQLITVRADIVNNLVAAYKALGGGWLPANFNGFIPDSVKEEMSARTNWGRLLDPSAITPEERDLSQPPSPLPRLEKRLPDV